MDFSEFLSMVQVNSITIGKGVAEHDLRLLLGAFVEPDTAASELESGGFLTAHIRLRLVNPNLLLGLEDDRLSLLERVLLTYALAVLVIRRLFESIEHGGFDLAGYFKRMARQLATVNYADRPIVLDVILARHLQPDTAKLAVNSAILAVAMTRRFTEHESTLSRVCMAALLLDVGRHRASTLNDDTADLAISTAVIHMAMGDLRGDSIERTIVTFEAQRLLSGTIATEIYPDAIEPTVDSHIVATARRFTELVSQQDDGTQLTAAAAIEVLRRRASSDLAQMTLDLLVDALGLIPRGAAVELNSGYHAVVTRAGPAPSKYDHPTVRLVTDNHGARVDPIIVKLDADNNEEAEQHRPVLRVLSRPNALVRSAQRDVTGPFFEWVGQRKETEARVRAWLGEYQKTAEEPPDARRSAETTASHVVVSGDARRAALDWDGTRTADTESTRVLQRSSAAAEYEYRRSSSHDALPDDFATHDPAESSVPARASDQTALAPERLRSTSGGTPSVPAGAPTGRPGLAPRTETGGIYRRTASSAHAAVLSTSESARSDSMQFVRAEAAHPSPDSHSSPGAPAADDSARPTTDVRHSINTLQPHGTTGASPTSPSAGELNSEVGSGVLRSATGKKRTPSAQREAVASSESLDEIDTDAVGPAARSGVLPRLGSSDRHATLTPLSGSKPIASRPEATTPLAGVIQEATLRGVRPTPGGQEMVSESGARAAIFKRSRTTSSHKLAPTERLATNAQTPTDSSGRRTIKEHLDAANHGLAITPVSVPTVDETPAPFAGMLRRRKTTGSSTVVTKSMTEKVRDESGTVAASPPLGSNPSGRREGNPQAGIVPPRADTADTPLMPVEVLKALDTVTGPTPADDDE
jgi:hypothetical protein